MINFNNLKGFGGAPPQAPEAELGYDPISDTKLAALKLESLRLGLGAGGPNPDGGGGGFYPMPMPPRDLYFQPTTPVTTRQENINNMYSTTDANGIIQNPNSIYDKKSLYSYVSQNAVTSQELATAIDAKAKSLSIRPELDPRYGGPLTPDSYYIPPPPPPLNLFSPPNPDGGGRGNWGDDYDKAGILPVYRPDDYYRTIDLIPSNDNNKLFFDCKQSDGVFVYTKEFVSQYGTLQLQKKMQFYTDKGFLNKLNPAELGVKKMSNGRYKFIYNAENGIQTLIVSPKGVLVNIKSGGC